MTSRSYSVFLDDTPIERVTSWEGHGLTALCLSALGLTVTLYLSPENWRKLAQFMREDATVQEMLAEPAPATVSQ